MIAILDPSHLKDAGQIEFAEGRPSSEGVARALDDEGGYRQIFDDVPSQDVGAPRRCQRKPQDDNSRYPIRDSGFSGRKTGDPAAHRFATDK